MTIAKRKTTPVPHACAWSRPSHFGGRATCSRKATVEEGGKWWCRRHAPSAVRGPDAPTRADASDRAFELRERARRVEASIVDLAADFAANRHGPKGFDVHTVLDRLERLGRRLGDIRGRIERTGAGAPKRKGKR